MATEKPNVRAYLTVQNFEALQEYAKINKVKSLSSAIDSILTEYFGRTPQEAASDARSVEERLSSLERRMESLERKQ